VLCISNNKRHLIDTFYTLHQHILATEDSSKHLGVTVSDDLTWKKHVNATATKGNYTLELLRRNLHGCTSQVKASAYTTLVRPSLEYASSVRDPITAADAHTLEQVQRKAARYVTNRYTDQTPGCVTQMIVDLGWQSLQHRRYLACITMLFKIHNDVVVMPDSPLSTIEGFKAEVNIPPIH